VTRPSGPQPYAHPYLAGVGLGLVLLAAFVLAGRGLGASGAFNTTVAGAVSAVDPALAARNPWFASYVAVDGGPWRAWPLPEIAGVMVGGALSAWAARRWHVEVVRGSQIGVANRLVLACGGGMTMGAGSILARGCTSGQALTGGALMSVGSWLFMLSAFAAAFLVSPFLERAWR